MRSRLTTAAIAMAAPILALPLLAGCGTGPAASTTASTTATASKLKVVASFYPLAYIAEQVGGDHVAVNNLTKPGAEPHDLELTPQQVSDVSTSDLAIYESGLAPAADKAITANPGKHVFDVSGAAQLTLKFTTPVAGTSSGEIEAGSTDPHFWQDPVRYQLVTAAVAKQFAAIDPGHASDYTKNAEAFSSKLGTLNQEFADGLKSCASKEIVTSHSAFAYLADRYGLTQISIAGLSPDAEPSAQDLASISSYVKAKGIKTIYAETLVSPAIANTVAKETGAKTDTLDPIEGVTSTSAASDYLGIMRANLATLKKDQGCQ